MMESMDDWQENKTVAICVYKSNFGCGVKHTRWHNNNMLHGSTSITDGKLFRQVRVFGKNTLEDVQYLNFRIY